MTLMAIVLLIPALLRRRATPALITARTCALLVNGNFLLVALTGVGIARHTIAMWPGIVGVGPFLFGAAWSDGC